MESTRSTSCVSTTSSMRREYEAAQRVYYERILGCSPPDSHCAPPRVRDSPWILRFVAFVVFSFSVHELLGTMAALAKTLRLAKDSEDVDLGGYGQVDPNNVCSVLCDLALAAMCCP